MSTGNSLSDDLLRPVRSQFLTILCVLTLAGSGFGLLSTIPVLAGFDKIAKKTSGNMNAKHMAQQREQLKKQDGTDAKLGLKMLDSMEQLADRKKMTKKVSLDIASYLLCLGGAFMLWKLKRWGYFIYVAGVLLWIAAPVAVYGFGMFVAGMESGVKLFTGILFIILYSFNLKDLRAAENYYLVNNI